MGVTSNPCYRELGDSPIGRADFDGGNETRTRAKNVDKAKHRVGGPIGGVYSFDLVEGDPTSPDAPAIELGFVEIGLSDYDRASGIKRTVFRIIMLDDTIPARADGNNDPKYLVMAQAFVDAPENPDGSKPPLLQLHPRWMAAAQQLIARLMPGGSAPAFMAAGNCRLHVQEDMNVVVYNTNGDADPSKWTAMFDTMSLLARLGALEARVAALESKLAAV